MINIKFSHTIFNLPESNRFLLAVESRELSQADKSITRVYSFSKAVNEKKYLAIDALVLFYHSKMCKIEE